MSLGETFVYDLVWANLEARAPEHARLALQRRRLAEQLRAELLSGPAPTWMPRLVDKRFHNEDLFEHLLEVCHAALPFEARYSFEVSEVALELGRLLTERAPWHCSPLDAMCRGLCLGSQARRLIGQLDLADSLQSRAAYLSEDLASRGFLLRACGLLRWDQGRIEEATALLLQAGRRYNELGDTREEAICDALVGLLYNEEGELEQAESALRRAQPGLDCRAQPLLASQVHLALARCLALTQRQAEARGLRENAWASYRCPTREESLDSLLWLEGQVSDALGDHADAAQLFDTVRRRYIVQGCQPEATLATIQLSMSLAQQGRGEESVALKAELAAAFGERRAFKLTLAALDFLDHEAVNGFIDPETWSRHLAPKYLLSFRMLSVFLRPVPFV
jgi:tetratricopeptide (TPR) repeat protein